MKKNLILCILDGWGESKKIKGNAIAMANTPNWDKLCNSPKALLSASGSSVGLPENQMGNSEVGHTHIGSGRTVQQILPIINDSIEQNILKENSKILKLIKRLKSSGKACHLVGIISDGGVHAHQNHFEAIIDILSNHGVQVYIHAITDGRDSSPKGAKGYMQTLCNKISHLDNVQIATICGRYYSMDRDNRWDRTNLSITAMQANTNKKFNNPVQYIEKNYINGISDEFVIPACNSNFQGIVKNDCLLITLYRSDRIKQLLNYLLRENFSYVLGMVDYFKEFSKKTECIFPKQKIVNTLGEVISNEKLSQLRIAETEKYAHVTYFFSGGKEKPFVNEDRIMINSPKVKNYVETPEMSANSITNSLKEIICKKSYNFI